MDKNDNIVNENVYYEVITKDLYVFFFSLTVLFVKIFEYFSKNDNFWTFCLENDILGKNPLKLYWFSEKNHLNVT